MQVLTNTFGLFSLKTLQDLLGQLLIEAHNKKAIALTLSVKLELGLIIPDECISLH